MDLRYQARDQVVNSQLVFFPAARFFEQFRNDQADFYSEYMDQLKMVVKREHMSSNPIMETFR